MTELGPPMSVRSATLAQRRAHVEAVRSRWLAIVTLVLLMVIASAVIYRNGLGTTFFFDEWAFVIDRQPWRWDILLTPYNGHLSLLPLLVFKGLFMSVGLGPYWVYRLVLLGFHLLCVTLVFVYARRRVGDALAVCAAALVLFLGTAWHDLLVPFQIGFLGSVAGGLAMLIALDRRTLAGDIAAAAALAVSLSSSTLGVSFALAAFVEVLWLPGRWRRVWLVALPFAFYLVWYADYRNSPQSVRAAVGPLGPVVRANLPQVPSYMAEAAATAFGGLVGLGSTWGGVLAIAGAVVLALRLGGDRPISARLLALLAAAVAYWGLLGAFRAQLVPPSESRYVYGGAVLILLVAVELADGIRVFRAQALVLLACGVIFAAVGNYASLRSGSLSLQDSATHIRAELGALEVAGTSVDPNYVPDQARTQGVRAGRYLAVVRAHGSPSDSATEIARQPEGIRQEADAVLARALGATLRPAPATRPVGRAPDLVGVSGGMVRIRGSCLSFRTRTPDALLELALPTTGLAVDPEGRSPVELRTRHFATQYPPQPLVTVSEPRLIRIGRARTELRWYMQVKTSERVRVCRPGKTTA
jgi:hypothetical protein